VQGIATTQADRTRAVLLELIGAFGWTLGDAIELSGGGDLPGDIACKP
jgi:hypothetical protein